MAKKLNPPNIPSHIKADSKTVYEVLYTDGFRDENVVGEMRQHHKQIVLQNGLPNKELWLVYIHEILHLISDENDAKLTEKQVSAMEKGVFKFLRANGVI